jgi:DNA-binding transcriptional LysR family regulator
MSTSCEVQQNRCENVSLLSVRGNYDSTMNQWDWDGARLLVTVAELGSLRRAAAALGTSQPTLGRRLDQLEAQLGAPLLLRHARGVELTAEGEEVVATAKQVASSFDGLARRLAGRGEAVTGRVRVSCTEPVASTVLPGSLAALARAHPRLGIDVVVDAHASDLVRREADVAIRMFPPSDSDLVARRVGTTHTRFYASEAYLQAHGCPTTFEELLAHRVIGPDRDPLFARQAEALGVDLATLALRTDAFGVVRAWVRQGLAIGALLEPSARGLHPVLEPVATHPVWLVAHPDVRRSAAVSVVWDQLAADLATVLEEAAEA